ncbi:hypothetical protein Xvie_02585 [Xenorhabdus vietnamensis]|uniref:Uncharacterized protein n=1 Tax=Xenorhabdus vietnamensis TaxID=351656 RepID=A0A1Y2SBY0_9GAMM|nr:hypothetical protein [Xenorhabdus vietnamensis]OTA15731.1 hypothetical protein Xvie_02585 [Xenorhabdus vietnamensis]
MNDIDKNDNYEFDNYIFKLNTRHTGNHLTIEKQRNNRIIFSDSFDKIEDILLLGKKIYINLIDKDKSIVIKFSIFSNKFEVFKVYQKLERTFHEHKLRINFNESYGKYKEEAESIYKKYIKICDRFKKSMREAGSTYVKLQNENKALTNKMNMLLDQKQGSDISNKPTKKCIKTSTGKSFNGVHHNNNLVEDVPEQDRKNSVRKCRI